MGRRISPGIQFGGIPERSVMSRTLFDLAGNNTTVRREIIAGIATFAAMASVLAVNPAILSTTGMDRSALVTATAVSVAVASVLLALATNYPIVMGPGGGINAYFAFTVCGMLGVPWRAALGLVFYSGLLFLLISVTGLRKKIVEVIPLEMKLAITCGIGLLCIFLGLKSSGIVVSNPDTLVALARISNPECILALAGIILTTALIWWKVRGAIIFGILAVTLIGAFVTNAGGTGAVTQLPGSPVGMPASLAPLFMQLDFVYFWTHLREAAGIVIALLFVDVFDNIGTLIGVCNRIGLLDEKGQIPKMDRALLVDATAAMAGSCIGTSTVTCYIESAVGVEEGGRTGLTAIVSACCMLLALPFTPLLVAIPPAATGAALVVIGIFMMQGAAEIDMRDFDKAVPAVITMVMIPFTFSISVGTGIGLIVYVGFMVGTKRARAVSGLAYVLAVLFLLQDLFSTGSTTAKLSKSPQDATCHCVSKASGD